MSPLKLHSGSEIEIYSVLTNTELDLPLVPTGMSAGFPSPAMDFFDVAIDLNKHLIHHPNATFYGKVKGESMKDAGINDGDLLVIDKSLEAKDGNIAVCYIDGEFTIKRIKYDGENLYLVPANEKYKTIKIDAQNDFQIWGLVTYVIKAL